MCAAYGKVYLVGAGPGDFELITVKALRLVKEADVILYDHLISPELVPCAKPGCELVSVGKFSKKHTLPQDEINKLLVKKAKEGKMVVRLKGGDPYLFGRGGEEAEECIAEGVEFEVVPGVTSALSAPCYGGMPPTHRDCTSDLAIVTGHRKDDSPIEIPKAGTVIFLMGVRNIGKIVKALLEQGWSDETPIAIVEHGTWYDQRVIKGRLNNFVEICEKSNLRTPGIFIVGKVVELQERLDWFGKKPNVLVMGNHPQRYSYLGNVVHRQIIECVAVEDFSEVDKQIETICKNDWLVFTSVNGAKYLFGRMQEKGLDVRVLGNSKIAAIGESTAARLIEYGIIPDLVPATESSAGLVEEFGKIDMKGKKVLLACPEVASDTLPEGLAEMGAVVDKAVVYKTVDLEPATVDLDYIDIVLFTSGSTVKAFKKYFGEMPEKMKVYSLGEPTQATAREHGIESEIIPPKPA